MQVSTQRSKRRPWFNLATLFVLGTLSLWFAWLCTASKRANSSPQKYRGQQYWKPGVTQGSETLYETPFSRFQIHQVLLEDGKTLIKDWLWYDESDNINVLVEKVDGNFLVLQQEKYAIQGTTLAVVGGLIEKGESPLTAAQRELQEELNMVANKWIDLGSYRAAANRGGGMTHAFLARNASRLDRTTKSGIALGELERQDVIELSREKLLEAVISGRFKEIKWTATVSLALLKTTA